MLKNNQLNRICWLMVIATMAIAELSPFTLAQAGEDDASQSEGFGFQYQFQDNASQFQDNASQFEDDSSQSESFGFQYEFGDDGSPSQGYWYRYQLPLYQSQPNEKSDIYGDAPAGLDPDIRRAEQSRRRSEADFHQKFQTQINQDIIHDAQQSGRRAAEFYREFQTQTDSSALGFKRLQQQKNLEQQQ